MLRIFQVVKIVFKDAMILPTVLIDPPTRYVELDQIIARVLPTPYQKSPENAQLIGLMSSRLPQTQPRVTEN